jgi:hypothetical protein
MPDDPDRAATPGAAPPSRRHRSAPARSGEAGTDDGHRAAAATDQAFGGYGATISLQVGAFRELKSAADLRARLQEKFSDVFISTVDSGGELPLPRARWPLPQRTRVGRDEILLQSAGFASFRVTD